MLPLKTKAAGSAECWQHFYSCGCFCSTCLQLHLHAEVRCEAPVDRWLSHLARAHALLHSRFVADVCSSRLLLNVTHIWRKKWNQASTEQRKQTTFYDGAFLGTQRLLLAFLRQRSKKRARQLVHTQDVLISRLTVAGISDYSCSGRYLIHIQFISTCGGGGLNPIPQYALLHRLHCHTMDPICAASVKEKGKIWIGSLSIIQPEIRWRYTYWLL